MHVVAYKRGGPSEIIKHGQTGYLAEPDDKKNMLSYVEIIEKIKRQECREWVEKNASADIFANKVVNWLNKVIICLLYTSPSPRDATLSRMPSSA